MTQTPFQRALDGYEDAIFRLPARRRRECIDRTLAHMRRTLPSDYRRTQRYEFRRLANDGTVCQHHAIVDAVNAFPAMRDRCVVSVAQAHHQRLWWLSFLLLWNSLTSGIDVFEYAVNWWLVQQRWCPRVALGPVMAALALICSDVRRMQASGSRVPSWCLAWQRAPIVGMKVCAWRIGWLQGWQWLRRKTDTASPQDQPDYSFLPSALRVALAAVMLCALLWPAHADAGVSLAAIASTTTWEVQTGGSDTNGGGYSSGGTDYSQQTSAQVSVTDAVTAGTTTVTSATANFTSAMVGNVCYIQGGTGSVTAGWYQVASYTNSTTIVVDRSTGLTAGTGVTLKLGGALASPGQASAVAVASNTQYYKAGSGYTISSASTNVSNGCVSFAGGANPNSASVIAGYTTTRGDLGVVTLTLSASTATVFARGSSNYSSIASIIVDGGNQTSSRGFALAGRQDDCYLCTAKNCKNFGFNGGTYTRCLATGCSTTGNGFVNSDPMVACESYGNTVVGMNGSPAYLSMFYTNTGSSSVHGCIPGNSSALVNVVFYGNGGAGVSTSSSVRAGDFVNVIAVSNGTYGIDNSYGSILNRVINLATYNNTSGATTGIPTQNLIGAITLSGDPFTNAASGDFSLNNTSGAGAACRAAGFPGVFPRGLTTSYVDIGAAQHQDSGGAAVPVIGGSIIRSATLWS